MYVQRGTCDLYMLLIQNELTQAIAWMIVRYLPKKANQQQCQQCSMHTQCKQQRTNEIGNAKLFEMKHDCRFRECAKREIQSSD